MGSAVSRRLLRGIGAAASLTRQLDGAAALRSAAQAACTGAVEITLSTGAAILLLAAVVAVVVFRAPRFPAERVA